MAIRVYKPMTAGTRQRSVLTSEEITKTTPEKSLTVTKKKTNGRNNQGKITVRHRGGGVKRKYRLIDFKRRKDGVTALVSAIEYDPNRSANIALITYKDGEKAYIIAPKGLTVGTVVESGENVDIKVGNGALLQKKSDANKLSDLMKKIGKFYNREVRTIISDMNVPLGHAIGNSIEVMEAIKVLKGEETNNNLVDLCIELATEMVSMGKNIDRAVAYDEVVDSIKSGKAYNKFLELVKAQGGKIDSLRLSDDSIEIVATEAGIVKKINALELGKLSVKLGAGRVNKEDKIDYNVGIYLNKLVGDTVKKGDILATIYVNKNVKLDEFDKIFTIK